MNLNNRDLDENCWVIAYINRDYLGMVESQLSMYPEYKNIKAFIPTVKILKKQVKNTNEYEHVPLLFNYGFFKIKRTEITREYLDLMKQRLGVIHAWVKDSNSIIYHKPQLNLDNKTIKRSNELAIGIATSEEISNLIEQRNKLSIYDQQELDRVKAGDTIMLRGYPFEGLPAKVMSIDHNSEKIRVHIEMEKIVQKVTLSFESVFWTIYQGSYEDGPMKEKSLEELSIKNKKKSNLRNGQESE